MGAAEPIRNKKTVHLMADYCLKQGNTRNYLFIVMGVHTALRVSDLLQLCFKDVYDAHEKKFCTHMTVTEQKTGKERVIAINKQVKNAITACYPDLSEMDPEHYLFASKNSGGNKPISRIQAYRIIRETAEALSLSGQISCHSLRKTFGYHAWKAGASPVVLMDIYNHTDYNITKRYLGVSQDDRDKVYMDMRF